MINQFKCALSPVAFSRDRLNIDPDPWQQQVMMSPDKRILLNCSRQSGKSTIAAIIALHTAIYRPGSLILLISPSLRQSSELFKKVTENLKKLQPKQKLREDNKLSMTLENGSRVVSLPSGEATIRGFSGATLIIEDEASRVDDNLYRAIRPMLAVSGGRLFLMSTPWGKRGHYFEEWTGVNEWTRIEIPATKCPRIRPEFLDEERRALGDWWYQQEYMCHFGETTDSLFSYELIQASLSDDIEPLFPEMCKPSTDAPVNTWISDDVKPLFGPDGEIQL